VDVIGSNSLLNEVELIRMIDEVFKSLNINIVIKLNNRKVLSGISQYIEAPELLTDITTAMDKLDKIGIANVIEELKGRGIYAEMIDKILPIIELTGDNLSRVETLEEILGETDTGLTGLKEIKTVIGHLVDLDLDADVEFDQSLARGLNYYTGSIIEVKAKDVEIGSICGGGRYDDLTGIFGLPDISGVGVSFGADRIYDVMNELDLFPAQMQSFTQVLLVNFGEKEAAYSLKVLKTLQENGLKAELYPDSAKMKKQMRYADQKAIQYVILIGEEEMKTGNLTLKNMSSGEQQTGGISEIIAKLKIS
jgi:histidyl-tRNA synthetase